MKSIWFIIIGIIILIVIFLIYTYNRFVTMRLRVENQKSQIDVQLKRRYDLIPNLVETVQGYASHEREVLEAVTNARMEAVSSREFEEELSANIVLTDRLHKLLLVGEGYPELKASQNFLQLQRELGSTEDKIAMSRQFYNDTVMLYNTAIQQFPGNLIAEPLGFKPIAFFNGIET